MCSYVKIGRVLICCILLFFELFSHAEGSKELSVHGGNRAYLYSSTNGNSSFPFPTLGTMKVYVKVGEAINVGSSAQGFGSGTINLRAPDGSTYTSGTSPTVGLIANRSQEQAGPLPNAGGYKPFTITVQAGQQGVWEIDFISQSNGVDLGLNPVPIAANANWIQSQGIYIDAFDISVLDVTKAHFISGRVFTNIFSGILGTFNVVFNGIFDILTKDGYQYTLNNNGQAGNGYTFFVNNKGFRNAAGSASYLSVNDITRPDVQDPRVEDTQSDITQKIFFNPPSPDLPVSANTPGGGTTWLLKTPEPPTISNITYRGVEGTTEKAGTNPLGLNFLFTSSGSGTYTIAIDVNHNGVFTDPVDRKLTGNVDAGANKVYWDGLDGQNKKAPADPLSPYRADITIQATAGEVHFPFFDVERNVGGIILTRTNGNKAPDNIVYWDDTPITVVGTPPKPIKNLTGISSTINGHKWGTSTSDPNNDADFGNNKGIDTWAFIANQPVKGSVDFELQEADLEVDTIISNTGCAGGPVLYNITVKNNGPNDVTGAKFTFNFPAEITDIVVSSTATAGSSSVTGGTTSSVLYSTVINMADKAIRTFNITGKVSKSATGSLLVRAGILRPADVTDPDATDPDPAPPVDAAVECNALPSGAGCNNIKTNTTFFVSAPNAGPDQTVFQYATAMLAATGLGTWAQSSGDQVKAIITAPASISTTITGLNTLGVYHFLYTNPNGCADTVALNVIAPDMVIPNIFTPNNDGKNDVFKIKDLESYPGSQLLIFNRWGNEVYRANDYLNNWNGSDLAEGTYYYVLNRREHTGGITTFKGWVYLKRSR